ncbi:hypothetical protein IEN85_18665 [Pelagicoccus sp. NFK12]|uniref:Uncharacterized protein n=1 Tax=Pelagicoccus enzymogenes TaxID=2773457 RepID=A0A927IIR4_9BACT|nr:hypothetical protein [Pelagicoccus enzymogenes]MBD5781531.1 hypothetical protein [Pelagicoccus enzymogenes]
MKAPIEEIESTENPMLIANSLGFFLSDAIREETISLYEAYCINGYTLHFQRLGYTQPAWHGRVQVSTCIAILNHLLLAVYFEDKKKEEKTREWLIEAVGLNEEKREHYLMDRIEDFFENHIPDQALQHLQNYRKNYDSLGFDSGPYHVESFPGDWYSPEDLLLSGPCSHEKTLAKTIEDLIVQIEINKL